MVEIRNCTCLVREARDIPLCALVHPEEIRDPWCPMHGDDVISTGWAKLSELVELAELMGSAERTAGSEGEGGGAGTGADTGAVTVAGASTVTGLRVNWRDRGDNQSQEGAMADAAFAKEAK
jgi:hypothetical protein